MTFFADASDATAAKPRVLTEWPSTCAVIHSGAHKSLTNAAIAAGAMEHGDLIERDHLTKYLADTWPINHDYSTSSMRAGAGVLARNGSMQALARNQSRFAEVGECGLLGGHTESDTARALGTSLCTVQRAGLKAPA